MTTLTDIGALKEAQAGTGISESIYRIAGAGYTKGLYWDVMMGRALVPSSVSRLTARGRFLSELSTYAPSFFAPLKTSLVPTIGTGSATFTRATTATVMGYGPTANNGDSQVLLTCASGEARFVGARRISEGVWSDTFADGTPIPASTLKGYLSEGARTNLLAVSTPVEGSWTSSASILTANQAVGPFGTTTMSKFVEDSANTNHEIFQNAAVTVTQGTTYCASACVKAAERTWAFVAINIDAAFVGVFINLSTGSLGTAVGSPLDYGVIPMGNGVYRVWVTKARAGVTAAAGYCEVLIATGNGAVAPSYLGDGTSGIYVSDCMFEEGTFPSSIVQTTGVAVARNADIDSVPTASNITASAGWISLEYTPTHTPSGTVYLWGTYVDASNYTAILHDATNLIFRKRIAGSNYDATIANAFVSGTTYKMAATWGAAGTSIVLNGTLGTGHANTTAAQIAATMQWGADGNSLQQPFMSIRNGYIGQRQLSASEMQAITA